MTQETGSAFNRISNRLLQAVPIDFLVVFRIAFGVVMCWWAISGVRNGIPYNNYTLPAYHFTYYGFDWVKPIDLSVAIGGVAVEGMSLLYIAFAGLAICIAMGLWYRLVTTLFAVGMLYWFLIDKAYYLNHYYLCTLLSLMMPFFPAGRAFSVDAWRNPSQRSDTAPAWCLWLLRFQIGVPYFFGGIAKLNADWLRGQPMRTTLSYMTDHPWISKFPFDQEYLVQLVCWGGLLFDLAIVPLLLFRKTRLLGFVLTCAFHISNHNLWNIGIFPWLMIAATTVYFDPGWPRQLLHRFGWSNRPEFAETPLTTRFSLPQRAVVSCVLLWIGVQTIVPLRVFVLPGNPSWSEYSHHFSWHMLLRAKVSGVRVYATDPESGRSGVIDLRPYLTQRQLAVVGRDPRMIHQLCLFIADDLATKGHPNVELRALALVSLNGRKPQPIIDPSVDLTKQPRDLRYPDWIVDLHEPYRHLAWKVPLEQWESQLDLDLPPQMMALRIPQRPVPNSGATSPDRSAAIAVSQRVDSVAGN
ncbi:HTTM domain-containing protein [Rhodopirellula bahusiensis]|uniref:Vitamin K-dependent gamma-carboxylase n=1 Tax=Rhodopirellula bahusiensis TaxID=2014065 RepID=A0A2G1W4Z4_9BACT|nr:HTTM domain-containing protein [Rhodopirellula bahusiensis]PHQ34103.1 vitamin K-dependent gamma-carboxylase [Rhodopirellula bahusiensis]